MSDNSDAPIDEIRQLRKQISERFQNDPVKLVAHYLQLQKKHGKRLIRTSTDRKRKNQDVV